MQKGKRMIKVKNGQDPYSVIGKYIRDHITAIEDIIAVIEIDDITTNQLFMVDMNEENYFIWNNDWYEGEKDVALIDFFPVSEAINSSARPERTCVNCGRTVNNGGWYADGRTRCPIEEHYALPKDGYCHLWEKRNVTDDDYPERRTDGEIIPE
jgi:hypothetical protein